MFRGVGDARDRKVINPKLRVPLHVGREPEASTCPWSPSQWKSRTRTVTCSYR